MLRITQRNSNWTSDVPNTGLNSVYDDSQQVEVGRVENQSRLNINQCWVQCESKYYIHISLSVCQYEFWGRFHEVCFVCNAPWLRNKSSCAHNDMVQSAKKNASWAGRGDK